MTGYMPEYMQILRQLLSDPDAVTIEFQRISFFHKFIVDQLPYGQIDPNALVQGIVEFDGPEQDPPNSKPPLQWHFGGVPFEVCKAMRIQYAYEKDIDDIKYNSTGSLFIGYESTYALLQKFAEQRQAAFSAGEAPHAYPRDVEQFIREYRQQFVVYPTRVTPQAIVVTTAMFDAFIEMNFPWQTLEERRSIWRAAEAAAASNSGQAKEPTPLAEMLDPGPSGGLPGARIEYDGPARGYNSKNAFPYTTQTLFNDPSGLYNKVLWWYFGGTAFRITKAMRLTCREPQTQMTAGLLIGYQGPSVP